MASRFYFTNVTPGASLANNLTWTTAGSAYELGLLPKGAASAANTVQTSVTVGSGATTGKLLQWGRFVSPPAVRAGTLGGTISGVLGMVRSSGTFTAVPKIHIWVSQGDTNTVRGAVLLNSANITGISGGNLPTTAAGVAIPSTSLSGSVSVQAGDRLVVEIGWTNTSGTTSTFSGSMWRGVPMVLSSETGNQEVTPAAAAADLAAAGTNHTTIPGWLDFSSADNIWSTKFENISDDFNDNVIDPVLWVNSYENYKEEDGQLQVGAFYTGTAGVYSGAYTAQTYQLRNSAVFIKLNEVVASGAASTEAWCSITIKSQVTGSSVECFYNAKNGAMAFRDNQSYSDTGTPASVTWVPATHRWLRISESGGTMTWATSTEASATAVWDTRRTVTTHGWHHYQNLAIIVQAFRNGDDTDDWSKWDNLNVTPAAGPTNAQKSGAFLHAA